MKRPHAGALMCALITAAAHGQTLFDTTLAADLVADGLGGSFGTLTTAIVFVGDDTLLAVNRGDAKVYRIDLKPGVVVQPGPVVLDLNVISASAPQRLNDQQLVSRRVCRRKLGHAGSLLKGNAIVRDRTVESPPVV